MSEVKDYPPYLDYPKERRLITNADRIRAMSDEELAYLLVHSPFMIEKNALNWLKQEAE